MAAHAEVHAPKAKRYYRPELDMLRFFAFLLVFNHHLLYKSPDLSGYHASLRAVVQESGATGVCLFFFLSAFLITELLLREKERSLSIDLKAFYMRRILRIWPLYLLVLLIATLMPYAVRSLEHVGQVIPYFLLFCGNWAVVAHGSWYHDPALSPLWSISVEEQFYLLWPALMLFGGRQGIVRACLLILPLAWLTDFLLPVLHCSKEPALWLNSVNQFQFFALGSLLALALHRKSFRLDRKLRALSLAAALCCFAIAAYPLHYIDTTVPSTPVQMLLAYLCIDAGCVLAFLTVYDAVLPKAMHALVYLGKISFGLYMYHYFVRSLVAGGVGVVTHKDGYDSMTAVYLLTALLTVGVAAVSYRYFEQPILRFKERFAVVPSRPV